jgi:predicted metal-dependent hydrolase
MNIIESFKLTIFFIETIVLNYFTYVFIIHEPLNSKERQHNDRFKALLDTQMPDWRSRRDLLNRMPLVQENWKLRE